MLPCSDGLLTAVMSPDLQIGEIIARFEKKGYKLVGLKMLTATKVSARTRVYMHVITCNTPTSTCFHVVPGMHARLDSICVPAGDHRRRRRSTTMTSRPRAFSTVWLSTSLRAPSLPWYMHTYAQASMHQRVRCCQPHTHQVDCLF